MREGYMYMLICSQFHCFSIQEGRKANWECLPAVTVVVEGSEVVEIFVVVAEIQSSSESIDSTAWLYRDGPSMR